MLHNIEHASPGSAPLLLIAHGLYGSARNWGMIGKTLSSRGPVVAVDMRNHGQSPWFDAHRYSDLANDLAEAIRVKSSLPVDVMGHSMGGKAAMTLALTYPKLVNRLIVGDIAPVPYDHDQLEFITAMRRVDLSNITKRSEVEHQLKSVLSAPELASFFTQSIDLASKKWRLNLDALEKNMPHILGFPDFEVPFDGPVLFLSGTNSDYVNPGDRPQIKRLFPQAQFLKLNGAGHWLHADKPKEFVSIVTDWLDATAQRTS